MVLLRCEYLRIIGECLELQRVSRRVEQEHRPLLAGKALEAQIGFDHELGAVRPQPFGQTVEFVDCQQQSEVGTGTS